MSTNNSQPMGGGEEHKYQLQVSVLDLKYKENWSLWIVVNTAAVIYWTILTVQFIMGVNTQGQLGMYLSQVALQGALLFNAIYANRVWASGEADNEGGTK